MGADARLKGTLTVSRPSVSCPTLTLRGKGWTQRTQGFSRTGLIEENRAHQDRDDRHRNVRSSRDSGLVHHSPQGVGEGGFCSSLVRGAEENRER